MSGKKPCWGPFSFSSEPPGDPVLTRAASVGMEGNDSRGNLRKKVMLDKPARLIIILLFGFASDLSNTTKLSTISETAMMSRWRWSASSAKGFPPLWSPYRWVFLHCVPQDGFCFFPLESEISQCHPCRWTPLPQAQSPWKEIAW